MKHRHPSDRMLFFFRLFLALLLTTITIALVLFHRSIDKFMGCPQCLSEVAAAAGVGLLIGNNARRMLHSFRKLVMLIRLINAQQKRKA